MPLQDVMADVVSEKKEKKSAEKRYVAFSSTEWAGMETKQGRKIDPVDVKKLILGIFEGRYQVAVKNK
jgi:hypothetical protein